MFIFQVHHYIQPDKVEEYLQATLENARQSAARLPELAAVIEELRAHAESMNEELSRFGEGALASEQQGGDA